MSESSVNKLTKPGSQRIRMSTTRIKSKVVFLGDSGVGKTSIIHEYRGRLFDRLPNPTLGATFIVSTIQVKSVAVELHLWDTAGQEKFRSLIPMYLRGTKVMMCVYDVTNRSSFKGLPSWIEESAFTFDKIDPLIVVIANKIDLESKREVSEEEGRELAARFSAPYFETSAFDGIGIEQAIQKIAELQIAKSVTVPEEKESPAITVANECGEKKRCSC